MVKVLKFGGTSLKDKASRLKVVSIIKEKLQEDKLIVIVSAMGRFNDPYATDTLSSLVNNSIDKTEMDKLITCGEMISSVILHDELNQKKIKSRTLSSYECHLKAIYKNGQYLLDHVDTNIIYHYLKDYDVLIIPGFQGIIEDSITTLERGGSDYTALYIARELGLKEVEIYSDVCGIYSGDPKFIIHARLISHISYDQALDLASHKARIICEEALIEAKSYSIVVYLKSTFMKDCFTKIDDIQTHVKTMGIDFDYELCPTCKKDQEYFRTLEGYFIKNKSADQHLKYAKVHFVGDIDLDVIIQFINKEDLLISDEENSCFIKQDKVLMYVNQIHDLLLLEE